VKLRFTERADKDYARLQPELRKAFTKQLAFLLNVLATHRSMLRNTTNRQTSGRHESTAGASIL
jgi:mRNA-degrading endonuclease RelE of RelBE toxin-antitoxin system